MTLYFSIYGSADQQQKLEADLPAIVRDYIEHVRGRPEMSENLLPDYLDSLWSQANDYAKRHAVPCPVRRDEVDSLRLLIEKSNSSRILRHRTLRS